MNMASLMLLDELLVNVEDYILGWLPDSGVNCGFLPELVSGLMLAEQFKLDAIKDELLFELFKSLKDVPTIPDVVETYDNFKDLPLGLVKEILLYDGDRVGDGFASPTTKERFDAFVFWLSENESQCNVQDKREVIKSFNFDDFTGKELLTDVRKSGLYSILKIDMKVLELLNSIILENRSSIIEKQKVVEKSKREIEKLQESVKDKDRLIASQEKQINFLCTLIRK